MSSVYNLEPQPTAKVILHTTAGDLALELFAKQTPLASRNFLQLCLDGYYDNTIFHRLVPGFIVQGGDPTGTGSGGESSFDGEPFADEFHSRLKFNRRGLLGMANTGKKDDNGSQFFLTLAQTPDLTKTNTMFGRIEGDTIYNLMKMGEADLTEEEGSERPLYPTKITGAEIIINPFEDMVKRMQTAHAQGQEKKGPKKAKRKAAKQLLSFGADEGEEGDDVALVVKKPKFNPKLVSAGDEDAAPAPAPAPAPRKAAPKQSKPAKPPSPDRSPSPPPPKPKAAAPAPPLPRRSSRSPSVSSESEPEQVNKMSSLLERTNAQIAELKASMKRNTGSAPREAPKKKTALEAMIPESSTRGRKRRGGAGDSKGDSQAMQLFNAFKTKLESAPKEKTPPPAAAAEADPQQQQAPAAKAKAADDEVEDTEAILCDLHFIPNCQSCRAWDDAPDAAAADDDETDAGWMNHALSFEKDRLGKDLEWKRKHDEELIVIDPREKEKEIVGDKKAKRNKDGDAGRDHRDRRGGDRDERRNDRSRGGGGVGGRPDRGSWKDDRDRENRRERIVKSMGAR